FPAPAETGGRRHRRVRWSSLWSRGSPHRANAVHLCSNLLTSACIVQQLAHFAHACHCRCVLPDRTQRSAMSEGESGVLVIADALSGAAEVAAALDGRVPIVLSPAAGLSETDDADQHDLVVDLDCRYLPSEEARARTVEAISALSAHDDAITLVKVDSLLRGNIRAALSATLESTSGPVIFAPALPQQNRTTVDGTPFDNGVRLSQTRAWELELGSAPETLQQLCPAPARHLSLTEVRTSELLRTVIDDVRTQHLFTADAETMEDLDRLVGLAEATSAVLVGTSALARAIAVRRTALRGRGRADRAERTGVVPTARPPAGRVLTLLGTAADR